MNYSSMPSIQKIIGFVFLGLLLSTGFTYAQEEDSCYQSQLACNEGVDAFEDWFNDGVSTNAQLEVDGEMIGDLEFEDMVYGAGPLGVCEARPVSGEYCFTLDTEVQDLVEQAISISGSTSTTPEAGEDYSGAEQYGYYFVDSNYANEIEGLLDQVIGDTREESLRYIDFQDSSIDMPSSSELNGRTFREYILDQCALDRAAYPSAGSCQIACDDYVSNNWRTGSLCDDAPDEDLRGYMFVHASGVGINNQTCYSGESAQSNCMADSQSYVEWGGIQGGSGQPCTLTIQGTGEGTDTWCFSYIPGNHDVQEGTGNTCFYNEDRCITTAIAAHANIGEINDNTDNPEYCRVDTDDAGEEIYCMNNLGVTITDPNAITESLAEEAHQEWLEARAEAWNLYTTAVESDTLTLQNSGALVPCAGTDCNWEYLIDLINNIIRFMIIIASIIVVVMMIYAGWLLVSSQGSATKKDEAKSALTKAIVGFILVLTAWLIVDVIVGALLDDAIESDPVVNILEDQ